MFNKYNGEFKMQINSSSQAIQNTPPPKPPGGEGFSEKLTSLQDAIASNDLEQVQTAYDEIMANNPRSEHGEDPVGQLLAATEEALASGDIDSLSEASATFSSMGPPEGQGMGGMLPPPPPPAGSMSEDEIDAFSTLIESLSNDDIEGAQSAFESLLPALTQQEEAQTDGYTSFSDALAKIEEALSSGDSDLAEQYLQDALLGIPNGSLINQHI